MLLSRFKILLNLDRVFRQPFLKSLCSPKTSVYIQTSPNGMVLHSCSVIWHFAAGANGSKR